VTTPGKPNAGHLQWSVTFATGTLEAKATKGGSVVVTDTVQSAGVPAGVVLTVDRSTISADGHDLAFVEADIVDSHGVIVPQADNEITFSVTGPATLVGVDNGNSVSHESYKGTSRAAFSGKALAIMQATTVPGKVTIQATSTAGATSLTAGSVDFVTAL
jgi:beta-galactosidase